MRRETSSPRRSARVRGLWVAAVLLMLGVVAGPGWREARLQAGEVTLVDPGRVSAGVVVNLTGTGFATIASANEVTFTPQGGTSVTVRANAIATVSAARGIRRLAVGVPAVPIGVASIRVVNTTSGEQSSTATVQVIEIAPSVTELQQGETRELVVTGSPATDFAAGARLALGAGITVDSVTVESPTRLVAQVSVATSAALGIRNLEVLSPGLLARDRTISVVPPRPTNAAPTVNAGADQMVTLPDTAALAATASDDGLPTGSTLSLQWSQVSGPGSTTFGTPTAASTTATFTAAGAYVLQLTASDGTLSASDTVAIDVKPAPPINVPPTVNAGTDQEVTLPDSAALVGSANDDGLPTGSTLSLQWSQVSGPGTTTFGTPTNASTSATFTAAGAYVLQLSASDGVLSATDTVAVTVNAASPTNAPPTVNAGTDQEVTLSDSAALVGSANDDGLPAGSTLSLQWSQVSGPGTTTFGTPTNASTSATFSAAGAYVLQLSASDGVLSATDTVAVTVIATGGGQPDPTASNVAPSVNAGNDRAITLPAGITLVAQVSDDGLPGPGAVQVLWEQVSGPALASIEAPTQASSTVMFPSAGPYVFRVRVFDGALASTDDVRITVAAAPPPPNTAPVVNAGPDTSITLPATIALAATVSDDGRPAPAHTVVTWSQRSGPGVAIIANVGGLTTSATTTVPGTYIFRVVADDGALTGADEVTVIVAAAPAPTNAAPTIHLTADLQVTLPQVASLQATVADDGRPTAAPPAVSWTQVSGPGVAVFAAPSAATSTVTFSLPGTYLLRAIATDGELNASAEASVVVHPAPPLNTVPRVTAGAGARVVMGTPLALAGTAIDDGLPGGSTLATRWAMALGPSAVAFAAAGSTTTTATFGMPGRYVLELTASDGELVGSDTLVVTVVAADNGDLLAPVITLDAPLRALPGQQVRVNARVSDDIGVTSVAFSVDGEARDPQTAAPFGILVQLPEVAAPGQRVHVRASARDAAGRIGEDEAVIEIALTPDVKPPSLELRTPPAVVPGGTMTATALADDESGIARVEFFVGDVAAGVDDVAPYELAHTVPPGQPAGGLAVRADAFDTAGNRASVTHVVQVAAEADTTAPLVTLVAPATASPGNSIRLEAQVTDVGGIADVAFGIAALTLGQATSAPWAVDFLVPDVPIGTTLTVRARARDLSGNSSEATAVVEVVARPTTSVGLLTGQVIDDMTGLPVADAKVSIRGGEPGSPPGYRRDLHTDASGRYQVDVLAGPARVLVDKDGYASAWRQVDAVASAIVAVFDARLTPRGPVVPAAPGAAARLTDDRAQLDVPAGAVAGPVALTLASVSGQGLTALLPAGWTPLAAVHIGAETPSFITPAILRLSSPVPSLAGRALALVRWDAAAEGWRVVSSAVVLAGGAVDHAVAAGGQYALVLADATPVAPPDAVADALLAGVSRPGAPDVVQSQVTPNPRVIFASPDARSLVTGEVTSPTPLTSGLLLQMRLAESYRFIGGEQWQPLSRLQDVVLYQEPVSPQSSSTRVQVGPTRAFDPVLLERGVIGVELRTPGVTGGGIVGSAGGTVDGGDQLELAVLPGALDAVSQVAIRRVALDGLGLAVPPGVTAIDAIEVLVTPLTHPAGLSLPRPSGLLDASRVVLARVTEIEGRTRYELAGLLALDGDRLRVVLEMGGVPTGLPGIRSSGTYVLLQAASPLGLAAGRVVDAVGTPVTGAVVTPSTLPVASVSTTSGAFVVAAPSGPVVLAAVDERRGDRGERPAFLPAQVITPLTLTVLPVPPTVTSIRPAHTATGVLTDDPIVVTFSEAIQPSTLTGAVRLVTGQTEVAFTTALTRGGTVLELRPVTPLTTASTYVITLAASITDLTGNGLPAPVTSTFATVDPNGPVAPPAGTITASVPDRSGRVTVRGTQGSAVPGTRIFVENVTRGTSALALAGADGGFAAGVIASVADRLRVRIVDASDNATIVDIETLRQLNPDGSVSQVVADAGGVVEGPEGTRATIKAGTFPGGTVVTMKPLPVSAFPRQLTTAEQENFSFEKAISLDFDGATPQQYIDVSWPAGPGDQPTDQWVLTESVFVNGEWAMNVTDTVKYRDGRLTTASPPCPGVTAAAVYGVLKSKVPYGLNFAEMYADGRYKLKMSMEVFRGSPIAIPYAAFSTELPKSICFPAFIGRMSISPNTSKITIAGDQLAPSDDRVTVVNSSKPTPLVFTRTLPPYQLRVFGFPGDSYVVYAYGPKGEAKVVAIPSRRTGSYVDENEIRVDSYNVVMNLIGQSPTPITPTGEPDTTLTIAPVDVDVPIHGFKVVAVNARKSQTVEVRDQSFTFNVAGGGNDVFTVKVGGLDVAFTETAPAGEGNLVLRATPGTIDPTREEMGTVQGPARTKLTLASTNPDFTPIDIEPEFVHEGGLAYAFNGKEGDVYQVITEYDTPSRPPYMVELPTVRYVLRNVNTNQVIKTIFGQAPPRDEPVELEPLTDDDVRPTLLSAPTRMDTFDPAGLLTFRFSESMDPASLRKAVVVSRGDDRVRGQVFVSDQNRVATFVPDQPLSLGTSYTVSLLGGDGGARDISGNVLEATATFRIKTFTPRSITDTTTSAATGLFKDVAWLYRDDGTVERRHMFTALGGHPDNVRWYDATNPAEAEELARATAEASLQRIAVLETDKVPSLGADKQILVATTLFNVDRSSLALFKATEPGLLTHLGTVPLSVRALTFSGLLYSPVISPNVYARNLVLTQDDTHARAVVAAENHGLISIDIEKSLSALLDRSPEVEYGMTTVKDIAAYRDGVVAVGNEGLIVLGPSLNPLTKLMPLSTPVRSVSVGIGVAMDLDGNGTITLAERMDVAVVGVAKKLAVVKLGNAGQSGDSEDINAEWLFEIELDGVPKHVEFDEERSRVVAIVERSAGTYLMVFDLGRGPITGELEGGISPHTIFWRQYPTGANGIRLDRKTGLLHISTPVGLDTWIIADRCCDLGVEMTADLDKKAKSVVSGSTGDVLRKELAAIKRGVVLGLERAADRCDGFDVGQLKLIESGSSACLWATDPVSACGSNYQPLVSDHDISTFMPDDWYSRRVDDPNWDGEGEPEQVLLAGCVVAALSYPFMDPLTEEPKAVGETGLVFKDISFIPNYSADFDSMEYRLERTIEGLPGDADNDLAMGRQLLVMKHLTEAYGVDLRGTQGYKAAYAAVMVDEGEFETRFARFRDVTRIPEVEGYEWGVLMQFMLAKAKAYIRFKGASDERSAFNDFYVKQYHTAAKAGIRAAAARIVSHSATRDRFLEVRREEGEGGTGQGGLRVFRKNACLAYLPSQHPTDWPEKPCGSMEEYVAATAARTLGPAGTHLFTLAQVMDIYKFYRVKSDEQPIATEAEADRFIADVHNFVMQVKEDTWPIYSAMLASDPRAAERRGNREYAEGSGAGGGTATPGGRIATFLSTAKVTIKPKVFNRGFMSAPNAYLRAYIASPGDARALACVGEPVEGEDLEQADRCRLGLPLNGGALIYPGYRHVVTGAYMPEPTSRSVDAFPLKVDQRRAGAIGHVVFTLDLPERSANEADRKNNVAGVFVYVLNPATGVAPTLPDEVPSPVNPQLLAPDPFCLEAPQLSITQSLSQDGREQNSPAMSYLMSKPTIKVSVTNTGSTPVDNVQVCMSLSGGCLNGLLSIAPGATAIKTYELQIKDTPVNYESVATARAPDLGVSPASLLRVYARCEPLIFELNPNPNPAYSTVMVGGFAVRHYMAVDPNFHRPARGVTVVMSPNRAVNGALPTWTSGNDGRIRTELEATSIDNVSWPATVIDGLGVPSGTNPTTVWSLTAVNGIKPPCGELHKYDVRVLEWTYTQSIEAGSAIKLGFNVFAKDDGTGGTAVEADFGGSYRLEIPKRMSLDGTITEAGIMLERKAAAGLSAGLGFPGFSAESEFVGGTAAKAEGLSINVNGRGAATQAYQYTFPGSPSRWDIKTALAFGEAVAPTASEPEVAIFRNNLHFQPTFLTSVITNADARMRLFRTARVGALSAVIDAKAGGFKGTIDFVPQPPVAGEPPPAADENKTKPLFTAVAEGDASVSVGYEKLERLTQVAADVPGEADAIDVPGDLVHSIEIDGRYKWETSYAAAFDKAKGEIEAGPEPAIVKEKAVKLLEWVQTRLGNASATEYDGGLRFKVYARKVDGAYRIRQLDVSFRGEKRFGFAGLATAPEKLGKGQQYRVTFIIKGEGQAERVFSEVIGKTSVFVQLLSDAEKKRTSDFLAGLSSGNPRNLLTEPGPTFSASELYGQLISFVRRLFDASAVTGAPEAETLFEEELREGENTEFKLPFLPKAGLSFAPLAIDSVSTRLAARGRIFQGEAFVTEDYSRLAAPLPDIGNLVANSLQAQLNRWDGELGDKLRAGIEETTSIAGKTYRATKALFGPAPEDSSLVTFPASETAPNGSPYRGNTDIVPAGKPRYGIGDFYSLISDTPPTAPIDIEITYTDAEVSGLDESTVGLFRWNSATSDWVPVPSTLDTAANRVTASVTTTGLFTLGVRMPAGTLSWQASNWLVSGSGAEVRTTFTAVATGLRSNTGGALAPGSLINVDLPDVADADITYVTPDASPALPGMQVAAAADGSIDVTMSVRGSRGAITIVGFSDIGTAFGQATLTRP